MVRTYSVTAFLGGLILAVSLWQHSVCAVDFKPLVAKTWTEVGNLVKGELKKLSALPASSSAPADAASNLRLLLFTDVDETLVFPREAPFVNGLPKTDAFIEGIHNNGPACLNASMFPLTESMSLEYYRTHAQVVEPSVAPTLKELNASAVIVGLTSRMALDDEVPQLLLDLMGTGIELSTLTVDVTTPLQLSDAVYVQNVGTVLFHKSGSKFDAMLELYKSVLTIHPNLVSIVLVDNNVEHLKPGDLPNKNVTYAGIHYTGAYDHGDESVMKRKVCLYAKEGGYCQEDPETLKYCAQQKPTLNPNDSTETTTATTSSSSPRNALSSTAIWAVLGSLSLVLRKSK